jgi:hypothetical protein
MEDDKRKKCCGRCVRSQVASVTQAEVKQDTAAGKDHSKGVLDSTAQE